jgi:acyl-CoA synthetase (AMP-forming)/AMP-acid ligase II
MRFIDYLDKGASLGADAPCLTMDGRDLSYGDVQRLSYRIARGLERSGIAPGEKVAILSGNDPLAFACVFGISRAAAVWCPINPRNEAAENKFILDQFDCSLLLFHSSFAPMVEAVRQDLPKLRALVCLDQELPFAPSFDRWLSGLADDHHQRDTIDDLAMIPGTGGTTGKPKGVMLSGRNIEAMTALTLMGYPFKGRPVYLALAPLTHAAGVLCFPIMTLGGRVVIMHHPDIGEFLALIARYRVTHTFLPPTVIYMLLDHPELDAADRADGAAVRADRGADDDLDDAACRSLSCRRHDRDGAAVVGGTDRSAGAGRHHGRRRQAVAGGIARRDRGARLACHGRLLQEPGGHARSISAWLASHRRHRLHRRRRLSLHRRPRQGHDHHRRLQRLFDRGRERVAGP